MITRREAAIISAFTGILMAPAVGCDGKSNSSDMHKYAEEVMGRPVLTHEFGDSAVATKLKEAAREDFGKLIPVEDGVWP